MTIRGKYKNILVTGADGQIGSSIKTISSLFDYNFFFKSKKQLDITKFEKLNKFLIEAEIDIIINCAAFRDVEMAESKRNITNKINNKSVEFLAKKCQELNLQLLHLSTDYVFDGESNIPYKESQKTNPINYYGLTKSLGEKHIMNSSLKNSIIIRTSWIYSQNCDNFVSKVIKNSKKKKKLRVVNDQYGSPTYSLDLAKFILQVIPKIKNDKPQIYNFSNKGVCSRFEFAKEILTLLKNDIEIVPVSSEFLKINRPKYSSLDLNKY